MECARANLSFCRILHLDRRQFQIFSTMRTRHKATRSQQSVEKSVPYLFIVFGRGNGCTGVFISQNKDAVSAISTFVIAIFTVTLWIATSRLWRATTSLWSASERQHAISNRAFVFIEDFSYELTTADNSASVDVQSLPDAYKVRPDLFVTRFAAQPRWKIVEIRQLGI